MKIIRWLLSHTFLILLIVAVIYGYMFWGNLAGEDTPAGKAIAYLSDEFVEVESFVEAVKSKQAELDNERSSAETPVDMAEPELTAEQSSARNVEQQAIVQQPVNISDSHNQQPVKQSSMTVSDTEADIKDAEVTANAPISPPAAPPRILISILAMPSRSSSSVLACTFSRSFLASPAFTPMTGNPCSLRLYAKLSEKVPQSSPPKKTCCLLI